MGGLFSPCFGHGNFLYRIRFLHLIGYRSLQSRISLSIIIQNGILNPPHIQNGILNAILDVWHLLFRRILRRKMLNILTAANSEAQNVSSFRRWRYEMTISPSLIAIIGSNASQS